MIALLVHTDELDAAEFFVHRLPPRIKLGQSLFQLVEPEHCGISHHKSQNDGCCHHIPHDSNCIDLTVGEKRRQSQYHRDDDYQNIRRQLLPGDLLEDLGDDVGQRHQHTDKADNHRPVQNAFHMRFLLVLPLGHTQYVALRPVLGPTV